MVVWALLGIFPCSSRVPVWGGRSRGQPAFLLLVFVCTVCPAVSQPHAGLKVLLGACTLPTGLGCTTQPLLHATSAQFCVVLLCPPAPPPHFSAMFDRLSEPSPSPQALLAVPTAQGRMRGGEDPGTHFSLPLSLSRALQRLELEGRCLCPSSSPRLPSGCAQCSTLLLPCPPASCCFQQ